MIYAIQILQKVIDTHKAAIEKLNSFEHKTIGDEYWRINEIGERSLYIEHLSAAISVLTVKGKKKLERSSNA